MLQSATVQTIGAVPYTQFFAVADRRFPPGITIAGVNDLAWRVANPPSSSVANAELNLVGFTGLDTRFINIAAIYGQPSVVPSSGYSHEYLISAISSNWTGGAVPAAGSVRYSGKSFGVVIIAGFTYNITADVVVTVDFAAHRVVGTIDSYAVFNRDTGNPVAVAALAGLGVNFGPDLFGDGFNDRVMQSGVGIGRIQGRIAGPNAEEIGASYHAQTGDFTLIGAFAAKR
jgi:hypothetical protein